MNIHIRKEEQKDYFRVAEIHALSFEYSMNMGEVPLVDVHRHRLEFDPELSLVAEEDGKILGHCLFTPHEILLNGETIKAAILAPIAIDPAIQKKGIGAKLIEEGHKRLIDKGFEMSILLGHSDYYPRFGYQTNMFGTCYLEIQRDSIPPQPEGISERRVKADDIPFLNSIWEMWFNDVDLAMKPGSSIIDWISNDKSTVSSVVTRDSEAIGYLRYAKEFLHKPTSFLARDENSASEMLAYINGKSEAVSEQPLYLPVHPDSSAVRNLLKVSFEPKMKTWEAAMIKELTPNPLVSQYVSEMKEGSRNCGLIIWPVEFDVC